MSCTAWGFMWGAPWGAAVGWGDKSSLEPDATILPIPAGCLDADKTARTRVWKQYTNADAAVTWGDGIAALLGEAFAELESAVSLVAYEHFVATARGVHLDEIGAIVGRDRGPLTIDDQYRLAIIVDAATTYASGTPSEIIELATRLAAGLSVSGDVRYQEFYPAAYRIRIPDLTAEIFALVQDIMGDTAPAGVGALLSTFDSDLSGGWSSTRAPLEDQYDDRVFFPDMLSLTDAVSSVVGVATGTTYNAAEMSRVFDRASSEQVIFSGATPVAGNPFTVSAWVRQASSTGFQFVMSTRTSTFSVGLYTFSGDLFVAQNRTTTGTFLSRDCDLSDGLWHHLAGSSDGGLPASGMRLWLDGVELTVGGTSADGVGAALADAGTIYVGARSTGDHFDGEIRDMRVFDRALTDHEVVHLYLEGLDDSGLPEATDAVLPVTDAAAWSSTYGAVPSDRAHWASAREIGA